jgi:hypothetical protein
MKKGKASTQRKDEGHNLQGTNSSMRQWRTAVACAVVAAVLTPAFVLAQGALPAYPIKPVRVLVGLAAGGATDVQALHPHAFCQGRSTIGLLTKEI